MKRWPLAVYIIFWAMFYNTQVMAQGISRSSGIGLRVSYWNIANTLTRIQVSESEQRTVVDIAGIGSSLYFFSRVHGNWFFEFSLGAAVNVHTESDDPAITNEDISAIIPFLFGLRYDLLSSRFTSSFQPYIAGGGGPYWSTAVTVRNNLTGEEVNSESDLRYGAYAGGGVNILLSSWFALNFDTKYHFVDLQTDKRGSGPEFGLGFTFMWGRKREVFQIKETKVVVRDIYPAYYQFYNTYPLALVSVKNMAGYPIEVNVRCYVKGYSERPKDSGYTRIERGETKDIPVTAIFGSNLRDVSRRTPAVLDLEVEARAGRSHKKATSAEIMVHNRNAWNGEMDKLGFFVTPDDENVLKLSRKLAKENSSRDSTGAENVRVAKAIFEALAKMDIQYHRDPNIPFYRDDRVQYAGETLKLRHGDCDDLVVLYASLLESAGIKTAFVEVRDPEKEIAHLYLLFDSGVPPSQGDLVSSNEKRYVIRENSRGNGTIWIPVETTLVASGFDEAWKSGALEYLQDGFVRHGLAENWVKIIDVE
ncbi:transglutaminase-like domain-containing protein [candidate division KSB1 bacterium]|nr:transglutaminase-like domain-containing protein [candidate division KSB1 bacterium]